MFAMSNKSKLHVKIREQKVKLAKKAQLSNFVRII